MRTGLEIDHAVFEWLAYAPKRLRNPAIRGSFRRMLTPVLRTMRKLTPKAKGKSAQQRKGRKPLRNSYGKKVKLFSDKMGWVAMAGTTGPFQPHFHLMDDGTVMRFRKRIGGMYAGAMGRIISEGRLLVVDDGQLTHWSLRTGKVKAKRIIERTYNQHADQLAGDMAEELLGRLLGSKR